MNPNCDGSGPHDKGEVRVLPLSEDGNLILCLYCYNAEMRYRRDANKTLPLDLKYDTPAWNTLEVYNVEQGAAA